MVLPLGQMHVQAPGSPGQDVPVPADVEMVLRKCHRRFCLCSLTAGSNPGSLRILLT